MVQWDLDVHWFHLCQRAHWVQRVPKNYHDITKLEHLSSVQTVRKCGPANIFLWHLLWGLQVLGCQLHLGDQQHPERVERVNMSEDFKTIRKLYI